MERGERRVTPEQAEKMLFLLACVADAGLHPLAIVVLAGEILLDNVPRVRVAHSYATGEPAVGAAARE